MEMGESDSIFFYQEMLNSAI